MEVQVENLEYNIMRHGYSEFIRYLREMLARHPDRAEVQGLPVLARQQCRKQPRRWMYINLVGAIDNEKVTLAIRDDNVYLIGFRNLKGEWFHLGFSQRSKEILPEPSKFLECDVTYRSLLDVPDRKRVKDFLVRVNLAKTCLLDDVRRLSGYAQPPGGSGSGSGSGGVDGKTKLALARLIVVICESARMAPHFDTVRNGWDDDGYRRPIELDEQQVYYLWNWGEMSRALQSHDDEPWPNQLIEEANVKNKREARQVVQLLLNMSIRPPVPTDVVQAHSGPSYPLGEIGLRTGKNLLQVEDDALGPGQPLVEVLVVSAGFDSFTISVYDGKRGQIIYKRLQGDIHAIRDSQGNLILTGPYRAISAEGSFLIEVDTNNEDEPSPATSDVDGRLFWDCYDEDNNEYNKALASSISTSGGPVEVTYAVLSNAMEATVQVKLLLAGDDDGGAATVAAAAETLSVYGHITAKSQRLGVGSVLFSRGSQDKVPLASGWTVPLNRSVIAAPVNSPFEIEAQLYVGASDEEGTCNYTFLHGTLVFFPNVDGQQILNDAGDAAVEVTWCSDF